MILLALLHKIMYDLVVIGGGPAGMMAAGTAAARGRRVLLLEKNPRPKGARLASDNWAAGLGKKLLITGGGRCNITNNKTEVRTMLSKYKESDQFLFSAFAQFSVKDALAFFNSRGLATKEENEGRVFPVSNSAKSVFDVMVKYMKEGGVKVQTGVEVAGLSVAASPKKAGEPRSNFAEKFERDKDTGHIIIAVKNGDDIIAKKCVLATGGVSHPETGSTGEGFKWLKGLGHTIIENDFALVPVALADAWAKKLGGVTLNDIKLTTFQNGQKQESVKGNLMFTHFGITGPTVLNMSKDIGELLKYGEVVIELDLFPITDLGALRKQLQELLAGQSNKKLKNALSDLVPSAFASALLEIANIDGETKNYLVSTEARKKLVILMKKIPLNVSGLLGADKAVVSSGGVELKEVNFKTMQSRLIPNLYLVGDVLNIDRPSGGYSLQLCWTTGHVAGNSV